MKPSNFVDISRNSIKEKSENWVILMHLKNCPLGFPCKVFWKWNFLEWSAWRRSSVTWSQRPSMTSCMILITERCSIKQENQICKIVETLMIKTLKKVQEIRDCNWNWKLWKSHGAKLQTWDKHMLESKELGMLNPNNDLSYYAIHCPAPVKNRDFVLQVISHHVFLRYFPWYFSVTRVHLLSVFLMELFHLHFHIYFTNILIQRSWLQTPSESYIINHRCL